MCEMMLSSSSTRSLTSPGGRANGLGVSVGCSLTGLSLRSPLATNSLRKYIEMMNAHEFLAFFLGS